MNIDTVLIVGLSSSPQKQKLSMSVRSGPKASKFNRIVAKVKARQLDSAIPGSSIHTFTLTLILSLLILFTWLSLANIVSLRPSVPYTINTTLSIFSPSASLY